MYTHEIRGLAKAADTLRTRFPNEIVNIYAFGSRVRGDHGHDSDQDVLVIVDARKIDVEEVIVEVFLEVETATGIPVEVIIKDLASFELERKHHSPFYDNIVAEGVEL